MKSAHEGDEKQHKNSSRRESEVETKKKLLLMKVALNENSPSATKIKK